MIKRCRRLAVLLGKVARWEADTCGDGSAMHGYSEHLSGMKKMGF